jgi:N-acetylglucosaminyldiphosphoundecaprenol N-acetyl-beta-D-mannosaminyltransferase
MNFINVMGYKIFSDDISKVPTDNKSILINCMNPLAYVMALKDSIYKKSLKEANFLVLDGVYFAFGSIVLNKKNIKKNSGPDCFEYYMNYLQLNSGRVFFLGASESTIIKIKNRIKKDYPNIIADGYSPPFKNEFTEQENNEMLLRVNSFKPNILFVGMTAPKQEKWSFLNKNKINANLILSVGAVFDWFSGDQKSIHPIWIKLRLLWLIRTINRPEIWKRQVIALIYFWHVILVFLGLKKIDNN